MSYLLKYQSEGCRAAYFNLWMRCERLFGWEAPSVCQSVCLSGCSRVGRQRPALATALADQPAGRRRIEFTQKRSLATAAVKLLTLNFESRIGSGRAVDAPSSRRRRVVFPEVQNSNISRGCGQNLDLYFCGSRVGSRQRRTGV